ncbi:MAG: pseudouridine synthase [Casimicrobiaceae bacterium]
MHKMLAQCGYGSLRGIEELIIAGRITINRQPAEVGQRVGPDDQVRINGELVRLRFAPVRVRVLLYHKPAGEIVSRSDPEGRPTVFDKLPKLGHAKWIAVGRLDFNTEGLLLFTTSGELANRLMHPRYEVEREYAVRTVGTLTPEQERQLLEGVPLEDGPANVLTLADGGGEGTNHWYKLTLPEGRNREVRRLFEALGVMVSRLTRTRYGVVSLPPQLKRAQTQELEQGDLAALLKAAGLGPDGRPERSAGASTGDDDSQPVHPHGIDDDLHDAHADEVDGNRGTYGPSVEVVEDDEVDGNRAVPASALRDDHMPGSGNRPRQHGKPQPNQRRQGQPKERRSHQSGQAQGQPQGQPHGQPQGQSQGQPRGQPRGQAAQGHGQPRSQPRDQQRGQPRAQPNANVETAPVQGQTAGEGIRQPNGSRGRRGRRGGRGGRSGPGPGTGQPKI